MAVDVILEWNDILLRANAIDHARAAPEQGGPVLTARAMAIASAAMYDAFNSVDRMGAPFLFAVPHASLADGDAAVAQAAHDALAALFPSQTVLFDTALVNTLKRIPDGDSERMGRTVGAQVAQHFLADRANDGTAAMLAGTYTPNGLPGFHAADPLHPNQGFYAPGAMHVAPFVVDNLDQFHARQLDDATPSGRLAFLQSDEYTRAFDEVLTLGGDGITTPTTRTAEQAIIGTYWGYDGRPGLGTPPRLYNQIARTLVIQQNNTVAENARLFALLNLAMADAGLTSWNDKYGDAFWRPIVGIRNADVDGNPDTQEVSDWKPLGAPASNPRPNESNFTPPFPAYTSGHATFGAAAFQTMARFFGRDDISFSFVSDEFNGLTRDADGSVRPLVSRSFSSLTEAKLENAQSRIYLGIHWAFDRDDGIKSGDAVANYVVENVLAPKSPPSDPIRHNTFDPVDVNDDGECAPLDALIVINYLNDSDGTPSSDFIDVNDDGSVAPIDALMVINFLNRGSLGIAGSAEGEWSPIPMDVSPGSNLCLDDALRPSVSDRNVASMNAPLPRISWPAVLAVPDRPLIQVRAEYRASQTGSQLDQELGLLGDSHDFSRGTAAP